MLVGAHVSAAGGVFNAPLNAAAIGCEVFQMFTRSPQGGSVPPLTPGIVALFKRNCELAAQREWYIHCPYFINFASGNNRIRYGSIAVVRQELERGALLGATYVMAHLGSYNELGREKGYLQLIAGLQQMLRGYTGSTRFLIEISAGAGDIIGDTFEEIAEIVHHPKLKKFLIGVCFDTQHAFGSGYDLRTKEAVDVTLEKFQDVVGLDRLKMFHGNDSKAELGSHKDRHEHIGQGHIGKSGFAALVNSERLRGVNMVCETKPPAVRDDVAFLKQLRGV